MDLSDSGLLVGPADPVLTGERLIVSFQVPWSKFWVDAEAIVARVVHGRRSGEYRRLLALQFEEIADYSRLVLRCAMGVLPPAPPSSGHTRDSRPELTRALLQ